MSLFDKNNQQCYKFLSCCLWKHITTFYFFFASKLFCVCDYFRAYFIGFAHWNEFENKFYDSNLLGSFKEFKIIIMFRLLIVDIMYIYFEKLKNRCILTFDLAKLAITEGSDTFQWQLWEEIMWAEIG